MGDGAYEVLEILGSGAYATVCVAREKARPERIHAVKAIKVAEVGDPTAFDRARDEARILSRIHHPNVIHVNRLLDVDGTPVVEMELVRGASLDALLRQSPHGLPIKVVLEATRAIALALDHAYNAPDGDGGAPMRIVHRDVKPSNVLVGQGGALKLVDFGIAKGQFADRKAKSLFMVAGTQGFVAPERKGGAADTPAVDVYAMGLMLFLLATGRRLLASMKPDQHDDSVARQLVHLAPEGLSPEDQEALRGLARRMARWAPEERPEHREVAEALEGSIARAQGPDLATWAETALAALQREPVPPREHADWRHVEFLETSSPTDASAMAPGDVEAAVRRFLAAPGWETRLPDLQRLLARGACPPSPFLDIAGRATVPWWQFWARQASPAEVEAALLMLCDHGGPAVVARAKALAAHRDARISKAAQFLLKTRGS